MNRIIAKVALADAWDYDILYDYAIAQKDAESIRPGMRVMVPFGRSNRIVEGMVFSIEQQPCAEHIKSVIKAIDEVPLLDSRAFTLISWMKKRYLCTYAQAYRCFCPPGAPSSMTRTVSIKKQGCEPFPEAKAIWEVLTHQNQPMKIGRLQKMVQSNSKIHAAQFLDLIDRLIQNQSIEVEDKMDAHVTFETIQMARSLIDQGALYDLVRSNRYKDIRYIRFFERLLEERTIAVQQIKQDLRLSAHMIRRLRQDRIIEVFDHKLQAAVCSKSVEALDRKKTLNPEQRNAYTGIRALIDREEHADVLLHGVTGSGKTEVYMQLIEHVLQKGKKAILLVPEIALTPQTVAVFEKRFSCPIAIFHSRLSQKQRFSQWHAVKEDRVDIVIGARSAIFAPVSNPGLIVIDEEHEDTYRSDQSPKYNAVEVAQRICKAANCVMLCGSATPSVNTYFRCQSGLMHLFTMRERATKAGLPTVRTVDMRKEIQAGSPAVFAEHTIEALKNTINHGRQAMILINRRGYSQYALCTSCQKVMMCPSCSLTLKYHRIDDRLICHTCGFTLPMPKTCMICNDGELIVPGTGTQKVEEALKTHIPNLTMLRMDADTVTRKNAHADLLEAFRKGKAHVLLGTQMIAKGHDFPNVSLVVIVSLDAMLYSGFYNASEKAYRLMVQASGRAGRARHPGEVLIQTVRPDSPVIRLAQKADYQSFYETELHMREKLLLPPFCHMGRIVVESKDPKMAQQLSEKIKRKIEQKYRHPKIAQVLGPAKPPVEKVKNRHFRLIVIKAYSLPILLQLLAKVVEDKTFFGRSKKMRLHVDANHHP